MILAQIYQALLNKKKLIFFLVIFNLLSFSVNGNQTIFPIARVNKNIITNVDLKNEILILKSQFNNFNDDVLKEKAIKNLIDENIKELEIEKNIININKQELTLKQNIIYKNFLKNFSLNQDNSGEVKKIIFKKTEIELKWYELIRKLYLSDINLNLNEINEILKKKNLSKKEKDDFILNEKNKKFTKYLQSHFNKIKTNYIINIYE